MDIRFSDKRCLTPSLLERDGSTARRVEGVLESRAPQGGGTVRRFVDAVRYDGLVCRYRVPSGESSRWVDEDEASAYRPFSHLVLERLCTFERDRAPRLHRFPGAPPSRALGRRLARLSGPYTLSVLDTSVTPDGRLWLRAALRGDEASGWRARHRADDAHVEGWLLLADATAALGETDGAAPSAASPHAEVA